MTSFDGEGRAFYDFDESLSASVKITESEVDYRSFLKNKRFGSITRARPITKEFETYLNRLQKKPAPTVINVVNTVKQLLDKLSESTIAPLDDPQAMLSEDGSLGLDWEFDKYQFSIEVLPDLTVDWFWRNRETEEFDGMDEQPSSFIPGEFLQKFRDAQGMNG